MCNTGPFLVVKFSGVQIPDSRRCHPEFSNPDLGIIVISKKNFKYNEISNVYRTWCLDGYYRLRILIKPKCMVPFNLHYGQCDSYFFADSYLRNPSTLDLTV